MSPSPSSSSFYSSLLLQEPPQSGESSSASGLLQCHKSSEPLKDPWLLGQTACGKELGNVWNGFNSPESLPASGGFESCSSAPLERPDRVRGNTFCSCFVTRGRREIRKNFHLITSQVYWTTSSGASLCTIMWNCCNSGIVGPAGGQGTASQGS